MENLSKLNMMRVLGTIKKLGIRKITFGMREPHMMSLLK